MGLEAATFISQLVATNPIGASDPKSQGDDHLRLLKTVLQTQFPNLGAVAVTPTAAELNQVVGAIAPLRPLFALKLANTDRVSTTTKTDDPDLIIAVPVGTFIVEIVLLWQMITGIGGTGIACDLVCSGTATMPTGVLSEQATGNPANDQFAPVTAIGNFQSRAGSAISQFYPVYFRGVVVVSVAGNLKVQWAPTANSVNPVRMCLGAHMVLRQVA